MRSVLPLSFITVICHVLLSLNFIVGPVAAIGQETSPLPDAPITLGDDGRNHFNTSELAGNAVAACISNAYYPAVDRSFGNTANKWGQQIGLDTFFNVAKEFWPDVRNKLFKQ